ncbi:MAG: hypothetical protein JNK06_19355 [Candidatus Accumulibacter phosphatis]|nr:hypothetical protein [Candidatus Accumulibacter phosphatis]
MSSSALSDGVPVAPATAAAHPAEAAAFNPFPGLRPFEPDEDYLFFGRERQIDELLRRLRSNRFLAIIGSSGSGKSSLVRAGLIPALYGGYMTRAGSSWRVAILRPGHAPIGNLARALDTPEVLGAGGELAEVNRLILETTLRSSARGLVDCVRQARLPDADNVLVLVDQFEELFRFKQSCSASRDEAVAFVKLLLAAVQQNTLPIYVILTMRSDFIGDCIGFQGLPEAINASQYLVPRLRREELQAAIVGPITVGGGRIAPRLVIRLLNEVGDDLDQLPVLQHALMRLWDYWRQHGDAGEPLDLAQHEAIGTLKEALSRHAEEAYQELGETEQAIAADLFKALTLQGDNGLGIRQPAPLATICAITRAAPADIIRVVNCFRAPGRSFLMPPPDVPLEADTILDISHESLMRCWERLLQWTGQEARSAWLYRRLADRAALHEQSEAGLLRNPELQLALQWRQERQPTAAWAERYGLHFEHTMAFLDASKEAWEQELAEQALASRRKQRQTRRLIVILATAALVTLLFGLYALWQRNLAWENQRLAEEQKQIAEQQAGLIQDNYLVNAASVEPDPLVQALLLAELDDQHDPLGGVRVARQVAEQLLPLSVLKGHEQGVTSGSFSPDGRQIATTSRDGKVNLWPADGSGRARTLSTADGPLASAAFSPDGRHLLVTPLEHGKVQVWPTAAGGGPVNPVNLGDTARLRAAAFSPDGQRVVVAYDDGLARIWPADGHGAPILLKGHTWQVLSAAFSADGRQVVTASRDGTARLWSAADGKPLAVLDGHTGPVLAAGFSPDGRQVVTASADATARLWHSDGSGQPVVLRGHADEVLSAAFGSDGKRLLTASLDGSVRLWPVDGQGEAEVLGENRGPVRQASFSPDGRWVAIVTADETARLWPLNGGQPVVLRGHAAPVLSAAFSADSTRLITTAEDGTARIWPLEASEPVVLHGHEGPIWRAAFSPDGQQIVTAARDGTARLWRVNGDVGQARVLRGHEKPVWSAEFSPDGRHVVTTSLDGTVRLWPTAGDGEALVWRGHTWPAGHAVFSPDGRWVASSSLDDTVRLWPVGDHAQPRVLQGHTGWVRAAAFSPDSRRLASASADGTVRLWSVDGSAEPLVLRGHGGQVSSVAFSPDGKFVVTAARDNTVRIWPADGQGAPLVLRGHGDAVGNVVFSPDGTLVGSASADGTARVWRVDGRGTPVILRSHQASVTSIAFSPDSRRVLTASRDGTARVWPADGKGQEIVLRGHRGAVTSAAFSPDGSHVVTASRDGTARYWRVTWPALLDHLKHATRACLSPAQREHFMNEEAATALARATACEQGLERPHKE